MSSIFIFPGVLGRFGLKREIAYKMVIHCNDVLLSRCFELNS